MCVCVSVSGLTGEGLDARALEQPGGAVLVVPLVVPAVVDGVAHVLLLQLHVVQLGRHCRHRDLGAGVLAHSLARRSRSLPHGPASGEEALQGEERGSSSA